MTISLLSSLIGTANNILGCFSFELTLFMILTLYSLKWMDVLVLYYESVFRVFKRFKIRFEDA